MVFAGCINGSRFGFEVSRLSPVLFEVFDGPISFCQLFHGRRKRLFPVDFGWFRLFQGFEVQVKGSRLGSRVRGLFQVSGCSRLSPVPFEVPGLFEVSSLSGCFRLFRGFLLLFEVVCSVCIAINRGCGTVRFQGCGTVRFQG